MRQDFLHPPPGVKCVEALGNTIFASAVQCSLASGYSFWVISGPPVGAQVASICASSKCTQLVRNMQTVAPTECVMRDGFYLYGDILNPILQQCAKGIASGGSHTTTIVVALVVGLVVAGATYVWIRRRLRRQNVDLASPQYETDEENPVHRFDRASSYGSPAEAAHYYGASPQAIESRAKTTGSLRWSIATDETVASSAMSRPTTTVAYTGPTPLDEATIPLFQDPAIRGAFVTFEELKIGKFLDQGTYGAVYKGVYRDSPVAIKKLRAGPASDVAAVTNFLAEIKLMASISHPRIVTFIGATWSKPEDLCALIEFMDGGNLLTLLQGYDKDPNTPMGFDPTKLKIALDVAGGIAYLHARSPAVIHRDLKSNNILLSKQYNAKLTDFGISRETVDANMTMMRGTERWMAPEVIKGQEYDERADVFSFGVVLSELDTNQLPYATHELSGMPSVAIMQSIAHGQLTVDFSFSSDPRIVALGRECVSLDPTMRPTMADVRHRIDAMLYSV